MDLGLYTGRRLGEVLKMKWEQVDFERGIITPAAGTNSLKLEGWVPLHPKLAETLKKWHSDNLESIYVLELSGEAVHKQYASKIFRRVCKRAGVKGHYHRLRHTFCSRLAEKNINLVAIGQMAGHRSINTTKGYTSPNLELIREAFESSLN